MARYEEDNHQEALITTARVTKMPLMKGVEVGAMVADYLYAIPNGGNRNKREAGRLKRQGVKAGVSDLHLAFAVNGYVGLWIEMKRPIVKGQPKPRVSPDQTAWINRMGLAGYRAVVCYGVDDARATIKDYLGLINISECATEIGSANIKVGPDVIIEITENPIFINQKYSITDKAAMAEYIQHLMTDTGVSSPFRQAFEEALELAEHQDEPWLRAEV